jgi:hypothetical protein
MIQLMEGNASMSSSKIMDRITWNRCTLDNPSDDELHEVEKNPLNVGFLVYQKRVKSVRRIPLMG